MRPGGPPEHVWIGNTRCLEIDGQIFVSPTGVEPITDALLRWDRTTRAQAAIAALPDLVGAGVRGGSAAAEAAALTEGDLHTKVPARLGTEVHQAIEARLTGVEPVTDASSDLAKAFIQAWDTWYEETDQLSPMFTEAVVANPTHRYAGTADFIGLYDGTLSLLDWKTGRTRGDGAPWPGQARQLHAYAGAEWIWDGSGWLPMPDVERLAVVSVRPGGVKVIEVEREKKTFDDFLALVRAAYVWMF